MDFALLLNAPARKISYCGPERLTPSVRTKVVKWVGATYPETLDGPTDHAVNKALATLHPCKESVESVAAFLNRCQANAQKCLDDIQDVSFALQLARGKTFCPPDKQTDEETAADIEAIKQWLRAHRVGRDATKVAGEGWRKRYPCTGH